MFDGGRYLCALLLLLLAAGTASAEPQEVSGHWFSVPADWAYSGKSDLHGGSLTPIDKLPLTGGHFFFQGDIDIQDARSVLDFKNSSVIGLFHHRIFDLNGNLLFDAKGGLQSSEINPYMLRHGRDLELPPGRYRLITEISSPFLLAQPHPYLDSQQHYRRAINPGNALTLGCLGILFGLAFYYSILSIARRNLVDGMYAVFILTNLAYNLMGLQVFPDLFGLHWFYLISFPFLLFGNWAYILFVISLLGIQRDNTPRLYSAGKTLLGVFAAFTLLSFIKPNWSLELVRVAVGLYLSYGLICGIVRTRDGHPAARTYLIAISAFFLIGITAISLNNMVGIYSYYIEHLGLLSITVEAMLLSLVLAQQFALLHKEKEHALDQATQNLHAASTDTLTGLPNRYALLNELQHLPPEGSLTFIDLDGLKYYNDRFGHERGDELLRTFGYLLQSQLPLNVRLHRLGGDEFSITHPQGLIQQVETQLQNAVAELRSSGFELAGASHGSVHVHESTDTQSLMNMADERMYECKRRNKKSANN